MADVTALTAVGSGSALSFEPPDQETTIVMVGKKRPFETEALVNKLSKLMLIFANA